MPYRCRLALLVVAVSVIVTRWHFEAARRLRLLAQPNERSMHKIPVPTGGGWAVVLAAALDLLWLQRPWEGTLDVVMPLAMLLLAALSWFDDKYHLPQRLRFAAHAAAVFASLWLMGGETAVLSPLLPPLVDRLLTGIAWLWFINLFNFMDGIDGIAGSEVIAILFGLLAIGTQIALPPATIHLSIVLIAATAGFLWWNWAPARVYLGVTGSIPLGFLLGYLLIQLAREGYLVAAVLLPLAFVAEATLTLLRRLIKGEKVWRAHRSHFYQRAALTLDCHAAVAQRFTKPLEVDDSRFRSAYDLPPAMELEHRLACYAHHSPAVSANERARC